MNGGGTRWGCTSGLALAVVTAACAARETVAPSPGNRGERGPLVLAWRWSLHPAIDHDRADTEALAVTLVVDGRIVDVADLFEHSEIECRPGTNGSNTSSFTCPDDLEYWEATLGSGALVVTSVVQFLDPYRERRHQIARIPTTATSLVTAPWRRPSRRSNDDD